MNSYHVLELVGEGSFGRVYKGRKRFTGQVVALKFMPKVGRSEKELRSLKREIEIMRGLQHPNIVQLFDSFETENEVVVVTEYAEGQLFQILEDDGNLAESQVREIACQLVSALYYLHSHRILHRDMKPQNILLGKSGVVKLCDFGFARAMSVSTLVLTSIKGTPLYMSPELVEEKPYDHTADLWSLGCILYELHTGAPPFYTNSIFHLVQLIVRDPVKWPDTMSDTCTSFLKGLLTKDPQKRLSWPDLLHHPFVADGVLVVSDTSVFSPLTVMPSPDMLAMKRKQVAEKSLPTSGESRLLRKAREQRENRKKPVGSENTTIKKDGVGNERVNSATATASPTVSVPTAPSSKASVPSGQLVVRTANQSLNPKIPATTRSKHRGQISRDYEQEFPSVEVGPQLVQRCIESHQATLCRQEVDNEEYWENLADLSREQNKLFNYSPIIPQLKSKILVFKAQLTGGIKEFQHIHQPLKVLQNLILRHDLHKSHHHELGLPRVLFELIHDAVENKEFIKQQWSVPALGEMITVLLIYWEQHDGWMEEEPRMEEFTKPFNMILSHPSLSPLAPLAASVLSLFTQLDIDVEVNTDVLISLLKILVSDSFEPKVSPPCGWGLCDGVLSLFLYALSEHGKAPLPSCLNSVMFPDLWKKIGTSLASTTPDMIFCSANGLFSFLSIALFVFTKDPYSCIPLFSDNESKCVYTLGRLLANDCPGRREVDLIHEKLSALSCHLLCFPFALDLPSHTMSKVLKIIQTFPLPLLELPLSLLGRLLLCDPEHSVSHLRKATSGFFSPPRDRQLTASRHKPPLTRSASSLLSDLLQLDGLWASAAKLLTLLSHVARCLLGSASLQVYVASSVLQKALTHTHDQIRAATCRFLGNLNPFRPPAPETLHPVVFKGMIDCLHDSCVPVRRMACWAVGNWLGYIACTDTAGRGKEKEQNKPSHIEVGDNLVTTKEQRVDDEEGRRWTQEARRTASMLASLISDPDALTRRHCCAALGNLVNVDGVLQLLLEEDVFSLLLRSACTDSHNAVRQAAIATLCLYSQQEEVRQVLTSVDASKKLVRASQRDPPQCDYQQLLGLLQVAAAHQE
ncbi:serine/threonine-protein kinase 36 isoform X2 [Mugil cephalus]|uniref:serine/threonine-protein kinase 36 isoform X2 n=1 Tax=Mugil cephalus TaxID=48193 RepID=UPI001FB756EB|nr:serine/threonine-protein kinase 36 isoform X2 [Mugil cephalus]